MKKQEFMKNNVIFKKGDPGDCMYEVFGGQVGIFADYGTPEEKQLTVYYPDQVFGEMGLLEHAPRSATAVALEDDTYVAVISEEDFEAFFRKSPMKVLGIFQQLCQNLRKRTTDYMDVCGKIKELTEKEDRK